jgi:hypothetical protein
MVGAMEDGPSDGGFVVLCVEFVAIAASCCVVLDARHEDDDEPSAFPLSA